MASASDIQAVIAAALEQQSRNLEAQLGTRNEAITKLMAKTNLIDDSPESSKTNSNTPMAQPGRSSNQQKTPSSQQKTLSNQQKHSVTPNTKSPPANLLQMVTKNMPESCTQARIMWNLLEEKTIPGMPPLDFLREFNSCFSDANKIKQTAKNTNASSLIPVKDLVTLKSLTLGRKKVGKGWVHLEDLFVEYTQATLACLALRIWAADLKDSPHLLYKKACRQARLKTFWQAACGDAYAYMNINKNHAKNLQLLIPIPNDDNEDKTEEEANGSCAGKEIDLNNTSGGDDNDEDEDDKEDRDFVDGEMQDGKEED
ncbi:hypothetical protein PGT21_013251 [Puccinia graminis f. sp. tritici]|uniref:Uncharacterized protein n=1 Tax=Puccinia graminis f. sp. tritici TaxID=56615 RepID=A0A5B0NDH6_PUCGR|nr:hypothetical protein PGT21_013251 [Puccinia graminis f. sp. tritici]